MTRSVPQTAIPVHLRPFRGARRLRIALVGLPNSGKNTLFQAVSSTAIQTGELKGTHRAWRECAVRIGFDEARVIELPSVTSLHDPARADRATLEYLLWGDEPPPVSTHPRTGPPAPFAAPDVIVQVVDATALSRHLELTLELSQLGRPMVIALNMIDEAWKKGLHIRSQALARLLGVPVVPTVALMGRGIPEVFRHAVAAARAVRCPVPQPASPHIAQRLQPLGKALLDRPVLAAAFRVPYPFLLMQVAAGDSYFLHALRRHFPQALPALMQLRTEVEQGFARPLSEELHADRHHRAASLYEAVTRLGAPHAGRGWRYWLDELFLHPRWGLVGSLVVFAAVLLVVFELSARIDAVTAAPLLERAAAWQPPGLGGVLARAVLDGLLGLVGIVLPYMIPLVLLLVALEESGIMHRIAFVVDRGFHRIGLHGGVAVPFLLGLGCNVPAISAAARATSGRERLIASVLITFVPCSARSAIVLALAGKYLGGLGVLAIFALSIVVIAVSGRVLARHYRDAGPGQVQEIPAYALPAWRTLLGQTWLRTRDILTIVTPLLVAGSVVLAVLHHLGGDEIVNVLLTPVTGWWLGLPVALGVPILFGVLRKELSLLMVYQALGTSEIGALLDPVQLLTFLVFLTFYVPCVSTFAVMQRTLGPREALYAVGLSVGVALLVAGVVRLLLAPMRLLGG